MSGMIIEMHNVTIDGTAIDTSYIQQIPVNNIVVAQQRPTVSYHEPPPLFWFICGIMLAALISLLVIATVRENKKQIRNSLKGLKEKINGF